ncbi:hypothetical protein HZS_70 [Henneguya salminicola]|nr:hypothetical protein HZS_70 [Henneguya salminicola]
MARYPYSIPIEKILTLYFNDKQMNTTLSILGNSKFRRHAFSHLLIKIYSEKYLVPAKKTWYRLAESEQFRF